ncbi:unnamed protein product, partial [Ectocarpus sp. 6 AP-2014]
IIGSDAVVGSVEGVLEYDLGSKVLLPVQPPLSPLEASIRPFSVDEKKITGAVLGKNENVTSLSFARTTTPEVAGKQALLAGADTSAILQPDRTALLATTSSGAELSTLTWLVRRTNPS